MNNSTTLKEALNRQFVALTTHLPLDCGSFEHNRTDSLGSDKPSISFKSFERAYPVFQDFSAAKLETR